jgi:succinate dehydrogenase cytochrome b subunit
MAISGMVALSFVAGHMLGNLQIFLGQEQLNAYGESLQSLGPGLWIIRISLLLFFALHIWMGIKLKAENRQAKPVRYKFNETVKASFSSRTMIWSGLTVLAFFIYHILHFTARTTDPRFLQLPLDSAGRFDIYSMAILGFEHPANSVIYIVAVGLLCLHISHGIYSMFQSLGLTSPSCNKALLGVAHSVALVLFLGFSAVPVGVITGALRLPAPTHSHIQVQGAESPQTISPETGGEN